jgi:predicted DNA-binding transcriptional regulator AlpA
MTPEAGLWSLQKLAAFLGISPKTIYAERYRGTFPIPAVRIGKHLRFDPHDVERFLADAKESAP